MVYKFLVNRLRPFLSDMVSPLQSSFVLERGIMDNAIVLQEVMHWMNRTKRDREREEHDHEVGLIEGI
uniref:Reverse transcriptase domain-containing protein n=1 Tax=Cajanus cajan TaxID=3821 RepID=A0A151RAY6_CAJCA|nr:hypothetical protein KK1_038982 [Cajanus cajan]